MISEEFQFVKSRLWIIARLFSLLETIIEKRRRKQDDAEAERGEQAIQGAKLPEINKRDLKDHYRE